MRVVSEGSVDRHNSQITPACLLIDQQGFANRKHATTFYIPLKDSMRNRCLRAAILSGTQESLLKHLSKR